MDVTNWLVLLGILFSFAGTCVVAIADIRKSNNAVTQKLNSIEERVNTNSDHSREQYLAILRLTVMSEIGRAHV